MALSDYFRERKGKGDYCVVHRHNGKEKDGTWPGRGCAVEGQAGSMASTSMSDRYLSTCTKVDRREIPAEWRRVLDGPDSGLDDTAVYAAAQDLYAVVFADAWEEQGGRFRPRTNINDVVPLVPTEGITVVRGWIAPLDAVLPYPLFDLFTALGADGNDEGHGDPLYYLIRGCLGHGVGFSDWIDDHASTSPAEAARKLGLIPSWRIRRSPVRLDDSRLREIANAWVAANPPNPVDPVLRERPREATSSTL